MGLLVGGDADGDAILEIDAQCLLAEIPETFLWWRFLPPIAFYNPTTDNMVTVFVVEAPLRE